MLARTRGIRKSENFITARFSCILSGRGLASFPYIVIAKTVSVATPRGRHYGRATRDFITDARPYALQPAIAPLCSARYADAVLHYAALGCPRSVLTCENFGNAVTGYDDDVPAIFMDFGIRFPRYCFLFIGTLKRNVECLRNEKDPMACEGPSRLGFAIEVKIFAKYLVMDTRLRVACFICLVIFVLINNFY